MAWEIPEQLKQEFCATAKHRVAQALAALGAASEASELMLQMHTLAGEATMLGYTDLGAAARDTQAAAQAWISTPNPQTQQACATMLQALATLLPRLEVDHP